MMYPRNVSASDLRRTQLPDAELAYTFAQAYDAFMEERLDAVAKQISDRNGVNGRTETAYPSSKKRLAVRSA